MSDLAEVNWGLIAPLIVIQLILVLVGLISLLKAPATRGPKWIWIPIIMFITLLGPVLYFVIGRKEE